MFKSFQGVRSDALQLLRYVIGQAFLVEIRARGRFDWGDEDLLGSLTRCFTAGKESRVPGSESFSTLSSPFDRGGVNLNL